MMGVVALGAGSVGAQAGASDFAHPASQDPSQQFTRGFPLGLGNVQRQDTPNDPHYDNAEPDTAHGRSSTDLFDERFDLFGFPSQLTPLAVYRDGPHVGLPQISGFNAAGAWKLARGRPDVVVAILDTGIRWEELGLRRKIHLNTGELPYPLHDRASPLTSGATCSSYRSGTYDANGDGVINVDDFACDSRVNVTYPGRSGPPGLITGQDLIHAFGDCQIRNRAVVRCVAGAHFDNDANGYANDIAGWNFFDNTNDPTDRSSYFAAANHGTGRADDGEEAGNDGQGAIGVCPGCQFMPIRIWDTFVSDGNNFALGITYATDNGARVIEGANGSLDHTAFAEAASQYAYDHGVVQTFSGNDLNTADHNYPANYSHPMLIQGTVPDTLGEVTLGVNPGPPIASLPIPLGTQLPPQTYFRGANVTQYGGHSSISMEGATGSENTAKAAGAAGLVISAALDRGVSLTPDETREILEQTAERVTSGDTAGLGSADLAADPSAPPDHQWTEHFGWGRANLGAAVSVARQGNVPPEASIAAPDWFAPLTGSSLQIGGRARALRAAGGQFHWKLEWAPGMQPTPGSWQLAGQGDASGTLTSFPSIDLGAVRGALDATPPPADPGAPTFSSSAPNPLAREFTVQLEVSVGGVATTGIDRRVFTAVSDPTLRPGYPKRLGTGGEAPIRYAALTQDNVQELIVPTEDGIVHAYRPDGRELRGWPVHTRRQASSIGHDGAGAIRALGAPREPPRAPVIADLRGDGEPDVITAAGVHIYAWNPRGHLLPGFPLSANPAFCTPNLESQPLHHPKCGFLASPAVAHLQGYNRPWDIVEPALDGHLYAWSADGRPLPGYPLTLVDPATPPGKQMIAESINDPAIGNLNNAGHDDIVVSTNEEYGPAPSSGDVGGGLNNLLPDLLAFAVGGSDRVYAIDGASGHLLPGWPISITGGLQNELPVVGPGNDAEIARIGGQEMVLASATGAALSEYTPTGQRVRSIQQDSFGAGSNATDRTAVANLFESASIGDVGGDGGLDVVKWGVTLDQILNLALPGQNLPYNHLIGAYDALSGAPLRAWPTITDDYQFLSSSDIARVDASATDNQVLAGTGLGLLHAYDGSTGHDIAGFPKVTGGWLFAPAAISDDGRIADITREGYLFEWSAPAARCQTEWPAFRHDQQDSANYNRDGTPPDAPGRLRVVRVRPGRSRRAALAGSRVSFIAPGDNASCGTAAAYVSRLNGRVVGLGLGAPRPAGARESVRVHFPRTAYRLTLAARDAAGNLGLAALAIVNRCLAAPMAVTGRGRGASGRGGSLGLALGPIGLGESAAAVAAATPPALASRVSRTLRFCVQGGGRALVALDARGHVALVASTGRVGGLRGVRRGVTRGVTLAAARRALGGLRSLGRGVFVARGGGRAGVLVGVRRGRVSFAAVATARLRADRRALAAVLRRLGLG
ncbi:MAG: hypothetical protein DLM63_03585 [Solirubrobacterales bacterium]|nr:MAG: hypothetical protein DLM63_03585 [Solirubrobacterales bacterium]